MAIEIDPKFEQRILKEYVIWLTTVRDDGQPQPTPVWFIYENGVFTIYTVPTAQKVKNIAANPRVALNINSDYEGGDFVIITGEADFFPAPLPATQNATYFNKYAQGITNIGMTPESFEQQFSAAIRVTPSRVRGE